MVRVEGLADPGTMTTIGLNHLFSHIGKIQAPRKKHNDSHCYLILRQDGGEPCPESESRF